MNFKKCTSFLLAMYLLVSTSGLAFNVHYCEGEIAQVSSVFKTDEPCEVEVHHETKSCCAEAENDHSGCCSDEIIKADLDDVIIKQINFTFDYLAVYPEFILPVFATNEVVETSQLLNYYCDSNAPPLYQLFSQRVFYA